MSGPLSGLGAAERCDRWEIPYRIVVEMAGRRTKATRDTDRKPVVLQRMRHFLATGEVLAATGLPARIVRDGAPPPDLGPTDRLSYRWYDKTYAPVMRLLEELTGGRFEDGALARVLIMELWTSGQAPNFAAFADAWVAAKDQSGDLLSAEYAFLTDLQRGQVRKGKAERVLAMLDELLSVP